ncbi:MAG: alpha-amylase [Ignavibacteriaceae bacterium]|nr:cyclomaltodextrinase N-terminal domain-containing protein [Ignavibacteria bacterium]NNJ53798.1 alpha-amylase [Ignavibacteriaceae bacterium]
MKWDTLQLMVYGENLSNISVRFEDERIQVLKIHSLKNASYLFIDVFIANEIEDDYYKIIFANKENQIEFEYPLTKKTNSKIEHQGFTNEDVIYLIFADRFFDGNPSNNTIDDSLDEFTSADFDGRKGGDIEGIISKLDYLKELGVTAIWVTPLLENNMWMSYHGYAATDLYKIDLRFGSNDLYKELVEEAHLHGIKVILDHVSNHIGINHSWVSNPPESNWFNGSKENFIPAMHDKMAFLDIHGDSTIINFHQRGWFTDYMPDLNQENTFLNNYLIQNTLWWIEYAGIDGIREDTYPYNDQKYAAEWAEAILNEYPDLNIVGEVWQGDPAVISGYQRNSQVRKLNFDSNLPAVTDFAFSDAIRHYLRGEESIRTFYKTLAQDFVYSNPNNLVVFLDNHDIERAMFLAEGNYGKLKVALNLLLFTRGIPVIFYGTEIGIEGGLKHGELRQSFPGGFSGDKRNAFTSEGRTEKENEIYNYLSELLKLRKDFPVLSKGKMRHIYPGNDLYLITKVLENETTLILVNAGDKDVPVSPAQLKMFLPQAMMLKNLNTNSEIDLNTDEILFLKKTSTEIFLVKNVN